MDTSAKAPITARCAQLLPRIVFAFLFVLVAIRILIHDIQNHGGSSL